MAFKRSILFILSTIGLFAVISCEKSPSEPKVEAPPVPPQVSIEAPSSSTVYWDDEPLACAASISGFDGEAEWSIDGETASCVDGEFTATPPAGEHTVKVAIGSGEERQEQSTTITVKEGFSVTLDQPKDGAEYFVGDEVSCSATIAPAKYKEYLRVTVGEADCTDGSAELTAAGELSVRASAQIDGRTEAQEVTVVAKPVVAGKVYPLTDQGVAREAAGFTVTLTAGGEVTEANTDADGDFIIKSDRLSELGSEQVELEVAQSGDFYGSRAVLPASELLALVAADELGFILAPKRWTIRCGDFAGQATTIKLPEAFTRYDPDRQYSSFYMYFNVFGTNMYRGLLPEDRPLPVAFNRAESEVAITAADSTAFWQETTRIEEEVICRGDLLAPANIAEVPTIEDRVQVIGVSDDGRPSGGAVTDDYGHITGGSMHLPIDDFGPSYGQRHELAQVLGFGEQSEWVGITSSNMSTSIPGGFSRYSIDDVSHIQLYMDTVDLQYEESISFGVHEWRRVFDIPSLPDN